MMHIVINSCSTVSFAGRESHFEEVSAIQADQKSGPYFFSVFFYLNVMSCASGTRRRRWKFKSL